MKRFRFDRWIKALVMFFSVVTSPMVRSYTLAIEPEIFWVARWGIGLTKIDGEFKTPGPAMSAAITRYQASACRVKDDGSTECYSAGPVQADGYKINGFFQRYYSLAINEPQRENTFAAIAEVGMRCPIIYRGPAQGFGEALLRSSSSSEGPISYCEVIVPDTQSCSDCHSVGNPIHPGTGQKFQVESDYVGGPSGLAFQRTYRSDVGYFSSVINERWIDSSIKPESTRCFVGYAYDALGALREKCFNITKNPDIGNRQASIWKTAEGRVKTFDKSGSGIAPSSTDMPERVVLIPDQQLSVYSGGSKISVFDADGRLVRTVNIDGTQSQSFSYGSQSASVPGPSVVSDAFGRKLSFTYAEGRLSAIETPGGKSLKYFYDTLGNLERVEFPDGHAKQYKYDLASVNSGGNCAAGAPGNPVTNLLTAVIDESGQQFASYSYDCSGKALSTSHAGNVLRYDISYDGDRREVKDPLGTKRSIYYQTVGATPWPAATSQPNPASPNTSATSEVQYDGAANIVSETDYSGNRSCFAYENSRKLRTVSIRGLTSGSNCYYFLNSQDYLPANVAKTSVRWHPDWALPIAVAEPLRITYLSFNGQPDPISGGVVSCAPGSATLPGGKPIAVLCKRTERETSDGNGVSGFNASIVLDSIAREWSYTYNQFGQILTETSPGGAITTYAYYSESSDSRTSGDLKSITNALGQTAIFNAYDKDGRVLTHTEPTGLVNTYQYDPRGRLTRAQRGGEATTFTYTASGQLASASLASGYATSYTYDAAQRLTGWSDNRGASASYTLDGMGNRVAESITDAQGQAAWTVARTINSLNRVESITIGSAATGTLSTTGYGYDANGDLIRSTETVGGASRSTTLALDACGA
ncbi:hypothetical protein [Paracidovorax valerianellae]|uniref:hypothetical protein n=1 Tax=Paracidovorax valerianellae TaxID=187868 RepID=UPI002302BF1D|nr:hypothetical protein [Paracidovorax valerianellae]MDA8444384.1 hypothetical protein [Paracidovorax valerianellae]